MSFSKLISSANGMLVPMLESQLQSFPSHLPIREESVKWRNTKRGRDCFNLWKTETFPLEEQLLEEQWRLPVTAPWKGLSFFWHLCSWSLENCTVSIQRRLSPGATKASTSTGPQVRIKLLKLHRLLYIWQNFLCLITPLKIYSSTADIANPMVELVAKGITSAVVNTSG